MTKKKIGKFIFVILFSFVVLILINLKFFGNKDKIEIKYQEEKDEVCRPHKIKGVKYTTKDNDGNEYTVTATEG